MWARITLLFVLSVGLPVFLYFRSISAADTVQDFSRRFVKESPLLIASGNLPDSSTYLAGSDDGYIYLGLSSDASRLLLLDSTLVNRKYLRVQYGPHSRTAHVEVVPPKYYLYDFVNRSLRAGSLNMADEISLCEGMIFSDAYPVDERSVIVRFLSPFTNEFIIGKSFTDTIVYAPALLEKQIDGVFCTDGMLRFDRQFNRMVYTYYYRNQFFCTDTSLNLLYRSNTLDTTTRARIEVAEIESEQSVTLSTPPSIVNQDSWISGGYIFIQATAKARNDKIEHTRAAAIDVYSLTDGSYESSFYLPSSRSNRIRDFRVDRNRLIVLYKRSIAVYSLPTEFVRPASE